MVQSLVREGVEVVFGIPGIHMSRDRRRAPGRAEHPHGNDPQRTGRRAHGRRLRPRVRETGGGAGGSGHGRLWMELPRPKMIAHIATVPWTLPQEGLITS